jgi:hypothetical protein
MNDGTGLPLVDGHVAAGTNNAVNAADNLLAGGQGIGGRRRQNGGGVAVIAWNIGWSGAYRWLRDKTKRQQLQSHNLELFSQTRIFLFHFPSPLSGSACDANAVSITHLLNGLFPLEESQGSRRFLVREVTQPPGVRACGFPSPGCPGFGIFLLSLFSLSLLTPWKPVPCSMVVQK